MRNQRYNLGPYSFYKNQRVTKIWLGDGIFLAERFFQKEYRDGDWQGDLPVPDWDEWLAHGRPTDYTLHEPTNLFFTLWLDENPYKFAINAVDRYFITENRVKNEHDLHNWQVQNGVNVEDAAFGKNFLNYLKDFLPIGMNFTNYAGWCRWGGEYVQNPTYTE